MSARRDYATAGKKALSTYNVSVRDQGLDEVVIGGCPYAALIDITAPRRHYYCSDNGTGADLHDRQTGTRDYRSAPANRLVSALAIRPEERATSAITRFGTGSLVVQVSYQRQRFVSPVMSAALSPDEVRLLTTNQPCYSIRPKCRSKPSSC